MAEFVRDRAGVLNGDAATIDHALGDVVGHADRRDAVLLRRIVRDVGLTVLGLEAPTVGPDPGTTAGRGDLEELERDHVDIAVVVAAVGDAVRTVVVVRREVDGVVEGAAPGHQHLLLCRLDADLGEAGVGEHAPDAIGVAQAERPWRARWPEIRHRDVLEHRARRDDAVVDECVRLLEADLDRTAAAFSSARTGARSRVRCALSSVVLGPERASSHNGNSDCVRSPHDGLGPCVPAIH